MLPRPSAPWRTVAAVVAVVIAAAVDFRMTESFGISARNGLGPPSRVVPKIWRVSVCVTMSRERARVMAT